MRRLKRSPRMSGLAVASLASAPLALTPLGASAGVIQSTFVATDPAVSLTVTSDALGNDETTSWNSGNKLMVGRPTRTTASPYSHTFRVGSHEPGPSGGTSSEYTLNGSVINNSGQAWHGILVELITASNVPGLAFDPLAYQDSTPWPYMQIGLPFYAPSSTSPLALQWALPPLVSRSNSTLRYGIAIDVPNPSGADFYDFTLKFTPIVPEPATAGLMLLGAGMAMRHRGRTQG